MLETKTDAKTKEQYLVWEDNFHTYIIRKLTTTKGKIEISNGDGTGTITFL